MAIDTDAKIFQPPSLLRSDNFPFSALPTVALPQMSQRAPPFGSPVAALMQQHVNYGFHTPAKKRGRPPGSKDKVVRKRRTRKELVPGEPGSSGPEPSPNEPKPRTRKPSAYSAARLSAAEIAQQQQDRRRPQAHRVPELAPPRPLPAYQRAPPLRYQPPPLPPYRPSQPFQPPPFQHRQPLATPHAAVSLLPSHTEDGLISR